MPTTRAKTARDRDLATQNLTLTGPMHDHSSLVVTSAFVDKSYSFFKLPAEIRIAIYACLIDLADTEHTEAARSLPLSADPTTGVVIMLNRGLVTTSLSAALARTCRLIYGEFMPFLYGGATILAQKIEELAQITTTIGDFASSLVSHIIIYEGTLPKHANQAKKGRLPASDANKHRLQSKLPDFANLTTVTVCYAWHGGNVLLDGSLTPVEKSLLQVAKSKPQDGHFLCDLMSSIRGRADVVWRMDIRSWHAAPAGPRSVRFWLFKIDVNIAMGEVEEGGRVVPRWQISNAVKSTSSDEICVWYYSAYEFLLEPKGCEWELTEGTGALVAEQLGNQRCM